MNSKYRRGDIVISIAVMIQPLLIIVQHAMIMLFNMNADTTTIYRVVLTAIPMVPAIIIGFRRKSMLFFFSYFVALSLMGFTMAFFPDNTPFVISQGTRFLLPVVLPSLLCLLCVKDVIIVEKVIYIVSWIIAVLVLVFLISLITGFAAFVDYNMSFSYACLFPMVVLFSRRHIFSVTASLMIFVMVLMVGARGPALYFIIFVFFDLLQHRSRFTPLLIIAIVAFAFFLPEITNWMSSIGINSRTINMYQDDTLASDSGRSSIRSFFINLLLKSPFIGIGLFGDRIYGDYVYCHNLFLEILLNFGIPLGSIIIISIFIYVVRTYRHSSVQNRNKIIAYICALVLPFMTSGSYLIGGEFATFIGLTYLISNENKKSLLLQS